MAIVRLHRSVSALDEVKNRCTLSKGFVEAGDHESACEVLGSYWRGVGLRPDICGLPSEDAAGVLLQVGVLTSVVGEQHKSETAPMLARALIGEGKVLFEAINSARTLEADSEIGGAYIRAKDYDTAAAKLALVLRQVGDEPSELRAATVCRLAGAYLGQGNIVEMMALLHDSALAFEVAAAPHQRGKYHQLLATAYNVRGEESGEMSDFDRALLEYEEACFHFENCGNKTHLAITCNNRGELFLKLRMLPEAEDHLLRARRLFVELNRTAYIEEVDRSLAMIRPPSPPSGNLPANVIPFRASRMPQQPYILTVPDEGLVDVGIRKGDRLSLQAASEFKDGDVVFVATIDGELLARGYHAPKDGIRLVWAFDLIPPRTYEADEHTVLGVL